MSLDLNRRTWGVHDSATAEQKEKATRLITRVATDEDDRHQLLAALGLLPKHLTVTEHGMRGYRQGCPCGTCRKANAKRIERQKAARQKTTTEAST
jgi:hypothetical protein